MRRRGRNGEGSDGTGDGPQAVLAPLRGQTVYDLERTPAALQRMIERGEWRRHVTAERRFEGPGEPGSSA